MSSLFSETMDSLMQALEMEKGNLPLVEKPNMPAKTLYVPENDKDLIDQLILIRKGKNLSQGELAEMVGSKQQAISRIEKRESNTSLKMFVSLIDAMGFELQIVPK